MKHESHSLVRSEWSPVRSVWSSTVRQKQVGQTRVQLPQVRQRVATSSQRSFSRLRASRSRMSVTSSRAAHLLGSARDRGAGRLEVCGLRRPARQLGEDLRAALGADLDEQAVRAVEDLGQREVVAGLGLRPGPHRDAEAGAGRLEAVHGDDERVLAPCGVVAVGVAAAEEDPVLDRDPVELAGAHSDQGERGVLERLLLDLEAVVASLRAPEPDARREQELLPRVRADRVAEARLVVAALEPVGARVLAVLPADRELGGRLEILVDDRAVPDCRPDDAEASTGQRLQEAVEGLRLDHAGLGVRQAFHSSLTLATARLAYIGMNTDSDGDSPHHERRRFRVRGVVQGVGFRPFVYGLAGRHGLGGFVLNDGDGVTVEAEGDTAALDAFAASLRTDAPPLARVEAVTAESLPVLARRALLDRAEPAVARRGRDPARRRHLRRLPVGALRPGRPALPLPVPELHPVRPPLHDRAGRALRPRLDDDGRLRDVRRLPARVRGPGRPPLPRGADRLPRLRAAALDAARGGAGAAPVRRDPRGEGPRRLPPRLRRARRGGGREAPRAKAARGEAVRAAERRPGDALRGLRARSGRCSARRRGRSCSSAAAAAPRSPRPSRPARRGSA